MQTLSLKEAAAFLKIGTGSLSKQAKAGIIPGRKVGKCWVFVDEHLADWISGRYPAQGRELRVIDGGKHKLEDIKRCQSTKEEKTGGYNSHQQTASEYNALLGLK